MMSKLKKGYERFFNGLIKLQRSILIFTSVTVVLLMVSGVFLRYILRTDLFGIEDFIVIVSIWLYFIGGSYGSFDESHIRADILSIYLKDSKLAAIINLIASLITSVVAIVFTKWAFDVFVWGIVMKSKSPSWGIPTYVPQSSLFIGFLLMSFYFVIYLIRDAKQLFTYKK